jgi:hypothetical protein
MKILGIITALLFVLFDLNGQVKQTEKGEDFESFIMIFATDLQFQTERIKFPLEFKLTKFKKGQKTEDNTEYLHVEKWQHDVLFMEENFRPQIYDNFKGEIQDTDERLFVWIGINNGITEKLYFSRIKGNWFLIRKERTEIKD